MKKLMLFVLLGCAANTRASELIHFSEAKWNEIQAQSSKEQKYVFLDCFTDWCYWCKVMDKEAFVDTSVTNFINSNFIPVRREMEKDDEGKALSMKYHINAFPTYCIFNAQGLLVYKIVGYRKPGEFIDELKKGLASTTSLIPGLSAQLDPGFPQFYKEAFGVSKKRKTADTKTVCDWLDQQQDLYNEICWSVMWRFPLNDKYNTWILDNSTKLISLYGEEEVNGKIRSVINARCNAAAESKDEPAFNNALTLVAKYVPGDSSWFKPQLLYNYYRATQDWKKFAAVIQHSIDTGGYTSWMINDGSWALYEQCDDPAIIKQAIGWMDSLTTLHPAYASMDTYASLLYKDKQYRKAEEVAIKAIDLGKAEGSDTSATETLLANIRLKIK